jgi:hypothetical protein
MLVVLGYLVYQDMVKRAVAKKVADTVTNVLRPTLPI